MSGNVSNNRWRYQCLLGSFWRVGEEPDFEPTKKSEPVNSILKDGSEHRWHSPPIMGGEWTCPPPVFRGSGGEFPPQLLEGRGGNFADFWEGNMGVSPPAKRGEKILTDFGRFSTIFRVPPRQNGGEQVK